MLMKVVSTPRLTNAVRSLSITVPAAAAIAPTRIAALARFAEKAKVTAVARLWVFRRKWNTESGGSGTSIPEEVEQRIREVEHGIRRKWNIDSGGSGTAVPEVVNARR